MKVSTQTADQLGLGIELLVGAQTYSFYISGRGYGYGHACQEAEEKLLERATDEYILINKRIDGTRRSHPRSDWGDYDIVVSGDLYRLPERPEH